MPGFSGPCGGQCWGAGEQGERLREGEGPGLRGWLRQSLTHPSWLCPVDSGLPRSVYFLGVLPLFPHTQFAQGPRLRGDGAAQGSVASGLRRNVPDLLWELGRVSTFWASFLICKLGLKQLTCLRVAVKMKGGVGEHLGFHPAPPCPALPHSPHEGWVVGSGVGTR